MQTDHFPASTVKPVYRIKNSVIVNEKHGPDLFMPFFFG